MIKRAKNKTAILIATSNVGKIIEIRERLEGLPVTLLTLADFPDSVEIEESGQTFTENARLKAAGYALQTGTLTVADDSGLEVAALKGRPGVMSARYGGEELPFISKIHKLLGELGSTGDKARRARFVCAIAIADSFGTIKFETEAECSGRIAEIPSGNGGFGYDPIFIPNGHTQTFGDLSSTIKRRISHRGLALTLIMPFLRDFVAH